MVAKRIEDIANGVPRPREGTINRRVWDISDEVHASVPDRLRAEVLLRCKAEKINVGTASVEHCMWRKYRGLVKHNRKVAK